MKAVLCVALAVCVIQLALAGPLQQQVKLDPREELVQEPQSDLEPKLEYLPEENEEPVTGIRIDEGGLIPTESIPEVDDQEDGEQEVQQVQMQVFEDEQVMTTPGDSSEEDVQSTERSGENQSNESWFCSVFGCNKS
ncbi:uncharacterized protein LOC6046695 [Culex quinquefasciatus]|uniref:uncharacterized protein LOC6046695 n=1 Tax=Culex quinquefasciatus TaxID=7176 RepID=UPI0018E3363D|nr:uncharacterized protein LOC6046695 [Culex quinquefasciatus]